MKKTFMYGLALGAGWVVGCTAGEVVISGAKKAYSGAKDVLAGVLKKKEEAPKTEDPKPEAAPKGDEQEPAK